MKAGKFVMLRLLNGLIAFVLILAIVSTVYEFHYEITVQPDLNDTFKAMVGSMVVNGEFKDKTKEEVKQMRGEVRQQVLKMYNLHRPRLIRITERTLKASMLNLGETYGWGYGRVYVPVRRVVLDALPNTLILFISTTIISMILAIYIGVKKAQYVNSWFDRITSLLTMFFIGIPPWVTGSFLILFFVYYLKILPFGALYSTNPPPVGAINIFLDRIKHMLIPIMAVVLVRIWGSSYQIRNILLDQLQKEYVEAARGRGLPERKIVFGHAARTASPAIVTMALLSLVQAASGDIVLEKVLAWPGIGLLLWQALKFNDMEVIMGVATVMTLLLIVTLIVLDIIYVFLDPRIKYD